MLDLLMPTPRAAIDTYGGQWFSNRVKSLAGVVVDEEISLTFASFWCAVRIVVESEATLRLPTYERADNGDQREAPDNPVYNLLDCRPNPLMGAMPFRAGRTQHMVTVGNGFAEIERDALNRPINLWPIHPGRVKAPVAGQLTTDGKPVPLEDYLVRNDDGSYVRVEAQDMLHVPGAFPEDGRWAKGCVTYHRESIGAGLGSERVAATQFGSGNTPRVLIFDPRLKDKEQRREFRREWKEMHGSPDSGEVAILFSKDAKVEPLTVNGRDAQFLESRRWSAEEMARIVGVPLHMMNIKGAMAQGTVEQRGIEFVVYHLMPWLRSWEAQCNLKLFRAADRGRYFCAHRVEGLVRGDAQSRFNVYKTAIMIGMMSQNDCLRLEGMPGIGERGDKYWMPLNMQRLDAAPQQPPGRRGIGSDQSGSPADQDKPEIRNRLLPRSQRERLNGDLATLESSMRNGHRAAMMPVPQAAVATTSTTATADTQRDQVRKGVALIEVPDIRQPDHFSCGACAAAAVGQYFGVGPASIEEWKQALGTSLEYSTRPRRIVDYLSQLGLVVTAAHQMTVEDLRGWWLKGNPVIVCMQDYGAQREEGAAFAYGHYLTVIGVDVGYVFCQDSSLENAERVPGGDVPTADADDAGNIAAPGRLMVDLATWEANWHDIDAEGVEYIHYGIAVGREVHPEAPDDQPAARGNESPSRVMPGVVPAIRPPAALLPAPAVCGGPGSGVPGPCPEGGDENDTPADVQQQRDAEDKEREQRHEQEENALGDKHSQEDRTVDRQREREDRTVERQRQKEDDKLQRQRDKEDAQRESQKERELDEAGPDEPSKDAGDDKWQQYERDKDQAEKEVAQRHEREDKERDADRDKQHGEEDRATQEKRAKEDAQQKEQREAEDKAREDRQYQEVLDLQDRHATEEQAVDEQRHDENKQRKKKKTTASAPAPPTVAARRLLADAMARQARRELHALDRHRKRPDFDEWLAAYYAKETASIRRTLEPLVGLLAAVGCQLDPAAAAVEIAAEAVQVLGDCFNSGTRDDMTAILDTWATARAEAWADRLMRKETP